MKKAYLCELVHKSEPVKNIFDFTVAAPEIAKEAKPGQFLHVLCGDRVFLRRPISICDIFEDKIRFVFEIKGEGTRELSKIGVGSKIDIMGPLGNAFITKDIENPVLIGGGIGIFPLYALAKRLYKPTIFLGFRSGGRALMIDEFEKAGKTAVATDDGSFGYKGFAVELLEKHIAEHECGVIYSCGPAPMLRAVKQIAEKAGIACRVSLEQRMGCGIGACLVCSCETIFDGTDKYKRVCKDGPVFWANEVNI